MATPKTSLIVIVALGSAMLFDNVHGESTDIEEQVRTVEAAFAQTMADRDFEKFRGFLSEEAVFFAGETPLRGKQAVADRWEAYYEGEEAPFSWQPETVAVLESGTLALSSGPVFNSGGSRVSTFQSTWRLNSQGQWKIVFDKGHRYCKPPDEESAD